MSKLKNYNEVTKIYEVIINKKNFNKSIFSLVNEIIKNKNDEVKVVNEVLKKLNDEGYEIISVDPLKIKEI